MATPQQRQLETEAVKSLRWATDVITSHIGGSYYGTITLHLEEGAVKRIVDAKSIRPPYEVPSQRGKRDG